MGNYFHSSLGTLKSCKPNSTLYVVLTTVNPSVDKLQETIPNLMHMMHTKVHILIENIDICQKCIQYFCYDAGSWERERGGGCNTSQSLNVSGEFSLCINPISV
jgi:hypothetical protein